MAIPITIPRLGWNMEEGTFGGWLKKDGDEIHPGDRLFTLESEKAAEEIETLDGGILRIREDVPKVGDVIPVGSVIGYLVERGESVVVEGRMATSASQAGAVTTVQAKHAGPSEVESPRSPAISPRARRVASELGIDATGIQGSGRGGRIRERDVRAAALSPFPPASGGEGARARGEIARGEKVESPADASVNPPHPQPLSPRSGGRGETIPFTAVRRTIAARMVESQRSTAPVTLTTTVDATKLVALRNQFKSAGDVVPTYTDVIVKLSALALQKHLLLAGQWTDAGIRLPEAIHIGIAVDTPDGLRVPVIRDVATIGFRDLAKQSSELIERARAGKLTAAEMQGGCFTVSNLGAYDIDAFTPIINYPECAVLGVGRIARRPTVVGDAIVPRDQVTLSLTFDHRIVDGAPAARFLQALAKSIENPGMQP